MSRALRLDHAGEIYHIINRAVDRKLIFAEPHDYWLFERTLKEAKFRRNLDIFSYCIMPNHWHLVLSPRAEGDMAKFMHWLTTVHAQRWRRSKNSVGLGHVYQDRYRS